VNYCDSSDGTSECFLPQLNNHQLHKKDAVPGIDTLLAYSVNTYGHCHRQRSPVFR